MRGVRLGLVALAAAAGGSALGTALLWVPVRLFAPWEADWGLAAVVFIVSLPFALAGTAILTGLARLWRESLSDRLSDYFGIVLAAMPIGAVMPTPWLGGAGLFFGAIFALLTATVWALLYSRFALPDEIRALGHG